LKRHGLSHTKEKPFECQQCNRYFARRDLVVRHQQKLHTSTPTSPVLQNGVQYHVAEGVLGNNIQESIASPSVEETVGRRVPHILPPTNAVDAVDKTVSAVPRTAGFSSDGGAEGASPTFNDAFNSHAGINLDLLKLDLLGMPLSLPSVDLNTRYQAPPQVSPGQVQIMPGLDLDWLNSYDKQTLVNYGDQEAIENISSLPTSNTTYPGSGELFLQESADTAPISPASWEQNGISLLQCDQTYPNHMTSTAATELFVPYGNSSSILPNRHRVSNSNPSNFSSGPTNAQREKITVSSKAAKHPSEYPIILKILYGTEVHAVLLKLKNNTRSSIEKQAIDYLATKVLMDDSYGYTWRGHLLSVVLNDAETDVSVYEDDDLTCLLEFLSVRSASQFTICVSRLATNL
jgi:hypothetical protein